MKKESAMGKIMAYSLYSVANFEVKEYTYPNISSQRTKPFQSSTCSAIIIMMVHLPPFAKKVKGNVKSNKNLRRYMK